MRNWKEHTIGAMLGGVVTLLLDQVVLNVLGEYVAIVLSVVWGTLAYYAVSSFLIANKYSRRKS